MSARIELKVDELVDRLLRHTSEGTMTWTRDTVRGERFYYGSPRGVVYVYSDRLEIFNQRGLKVWRTKAHKHAARLFQLIRGKQDERTDQVIQAILDDLDAIDSPKGV